MVFGPAIHTMQRIVQWALAWVTISIVMAIPEAYGAESIIESVRSKVTVDLSEIKKRRLLRVLVNYSRTNFFFEGGQARGFEYELMMAYQKFLNKGVKHHKEGVRVQFVPVRFDELISGIVEGRGDIAAAGLTVTPERLDRVAFTNPYLSDINEVVITSKASSGPAHLKDLLGRKVCVRKGSSYVEHLRAFNKKHSGRGLKKVHICEMDALLVTEDILEMVNAGLLNMTVADEHIAKAWARVFPNIEVQSELAVNSGGAIAWAVRKESPELLKSLNTFIRKHKKGTLLGNIIYQRYYENKRWIKNALSGTAIKKLMQIWPLFEQYGEKYDFDPMLLAAMAFQESGMDNNKRSTRGAIGIMQVLPSTAADPKVGIQKPEVLENNIHAGTKYLAFIRRRYFSAPEISPMDRAFFSLAAYNAGPTRIGKLRRRSASQGLDPNQWFFNVEVAAAKEIGRETVTYVANISKYYITYRLQFDMQTARLKVKEEVLEQN